MTKCVCYGKPAEQDVFEGLFGDIFGTGEKLKRGRPFCTKCKKIVDKTPDSEAK